MSWTFKSNTYDGRYMKLTITESVDVINNKSTLSWTLESAGGNSSYYTIGETTVTINGTQVYHKTRTDWDARVFPAAKGSKSGSVVVNHGSDGKKSITVSFLTRVYTWEPAEYGGSITLTDIDRAAPTVKHSVSNITASGFKISATSSNIADVWEYSLDAGSHYTQFSITEGTSARYTVSGLDPNTTYSVKVRARRKYNRVKGASASSAVKTLGASVISSAKDFAVDVSSPVIKFTAKVFDASYYHKLTVKKGSTTLFTVNLGKLTAGSSERTVSLSAAQRIDILDEMPSAKTLGLTLELVTYSSSSYSTTIGTKSTKTCSATTSASVSAPTFTDFDVYDCYALTVAATGDSDVLIQNYSKAKVECQAGTAKNGASIKSYSASIGTASGTSTSRIFELGTVGTSGNLVMKVSCTDSRGYSTTVQKTVKVLKYEKPKSNSFSLRRRNEIDSLVQLSFSGSISAIKADGTTNTNSLFLCTYKYKKTNEDTYGTPVSILADVSASGTSFSFSSLELLELDAESSYNFILTIEDMLKADTALIIEDVLKQGTPIVALRKRNSRFNFPRIGINKPNPEKALDVVGDGAFSGGLALGTPLSIASGGTGNNAAYIEITGLESETLSSASIACRKYPYLGMHFIIISGYLKDVLEAGTSLIITTVPSANKPARNYPLSAYFSEGTVGIMAFINSNGNVEIRATGDKSSGQYVSVSGWWIK